MANASPVCMQLARDVAEYAFGEIAKAERGYVEDHLNQCPACAKRVKFVQGFTRRAKDELIPLGAPDEPCPGTELIADLEAGQLSPATAPHVRAHVLYCKWCREEYLLLRRITNDGFESRMDDSVSIGAGGRSDQAFAPSMTDVAIEWKLGQLRCTGVTGSGYMPQADSHRKAAQRVENEVEVEDKVTDPDTGEIATVRVSCAPSPEESWDLRLNVEPLPIGWTVLLRGSRGEELKSAPLLEGETVLETELPLGSYTVNLFKEKGHAALASFAIDFSSP